MICTRVHYIHTEGLAVQCFSSFHFLIHKCPGSKAEVKMLKWFSIGIDHSTPYIHSSTALCVCETEGEREGGRDRERSALPCVARKL